MRIVALNNLDENFKKIAIQRLRQKENVLLLDTDITIELSKAGVLKKYLEKNHAEDKILTYILNDKNEEELLTTIMGEDIEVIDGKEFSENVFQLLLHIDNYFNDKKHFHGNLKLPPEYNNIPKDYQDTVYNIYDEFKNLDNCVLFLLITGSVNRGCVFDKWSDIDLIIVLEDKNDQETRDKISDIVNKQKIKVGTTVYSKVEFESCAVDYKTMAAITDINKGVYRPLIISENLNIPNITDEELIVRTYESIPNMLHSMRRYTYKGCKVDYIKLFKDLSHFMRSLDWMESMYPKSYENVAEAFYNTYGSVSYSPNEFLTSMTTGENMGASEAHLLEKTKEFLDFCDEKLLKINGDKNDRKTRKLQNQKK